MSTKTTSNYRPPSLLAAFGELLRSWWEVDQIRVSSRAGRLLRIHPPCLISIDDRMIEVVSRIVSQAPIGPTVCYNCHTPVGPAELWVTPLTAPGSASVVWTESGREELLSEDEVQVWG